MQLKKYMYDDIDKILIFFDNWSDNDIDIIKKICDKCIFIHYPIEYFKQKVNLKKLDYTKGGLSEWTHMVYSIYEIFDLLDNYKKVLWLDCDIIIRDNFKEIFDFDNIAIRLGNILKLSSAIGLNIENDQYI